MTSIINPLKLSGLKQAAYVMECLVRKESEEQIAGALGGDGQLVELWKSFLKHNGWMMQTPRGYSVTSKGAIWTNQPATA